MKQSLSPQDRRTSVSGFLRRPSCSTGLLLSPSITGREKLSHQRFPPTEKTASGSPLSHRLPQSATVCSHLSPGYSGLSGPSSRRMSSVPATITVPEKANHLSIMLAQVTAERRPSSSIVRISNV
ncbi:hypothetical protein LSTR_LSTR015493 [Laodelphax striatellus]|uniref:Uncharacterized protein n=1 Tax=Laodelphax striatellus TaxID=195883 RepID=A0A482XSL8_LAOST|nr:hypothetical protein LSTR_LSTR015493 [Laodelphax striatellus]